MIMLSKLAFAALAVSLLSGCASLTEHRIGLTADGGLQPCGSAPRCVSSQADDPDRRVAPLVLKSRQSWTAVAEAVNALPRTRLVAGEGPYLRAEVVSPWGVYIDDVELLRRADSTLVDIRSTGRIGYYDFGVNRDRVAAWREHLRQRGLLRPDQ